MTNPPVINYEGSDYQSSFWEKGGREYEDAAEAIALRRLLPKSGKLLLELGAGAGRNTPRYQNFERIVLLDYSRTQLEQAQARLGQSGRYIYVAANVYHLPFVDGLFDCATMIRMLHHMADAPAALKQIHSTMQDKATFILEFANKRNLKAVVRYLFHSQKWNPFSPEPVEFEKLNFDFHPRTIRHWLKDTGFKVERSLTVSHFRTGWLKRHIPTKVLAGLDSLFQWTGCFSQYSPSVFVRSQSTSAVKNAVDETFFKCPACGKADLKEKGSQIVCQSCKQVYSIKDGMYDFRID
jgi:ubiquinone/menaquinone biosynthesis C-methylase UbiE/uncharacterized protein YbaR (Trm112 family)